MTATLSASGQLEIPEVFRRVDALQPGQRCEIERVGQREYRISIAMSTAGSERPKETLLVMLLGCPVKDWWVEPDRSERTSLQPFLP